MQKIRTEYLTNPEFDPQVVAKASSAAEGLCKWIKGMEVFHRVSKVWFWSLPLGAMESSFPRVFTLSIEFIIKLHKCTKAFVDWL